MSEEYPKAILASYATFKELYNVGKYRSPYQILGEFIIYVIRIEGIYSFNLSEMQGKLNSIFGFDNLPLAVIRSAVKSIDFLTVSNGSYNVNTQKIKSTNNEFSGYKEFAESSSKELENSLINYARENYSGRNIDEKILIREFISYLLDKDFSSYYGEIISKFILSKENDESFREKAQTVREGGILYSGLTYNISEFGSLSENLTLFFDTEILFDIMGYNGKLFQTLAQDLLKLVNTAKIQSKGKIHLRFFKEIKSEIDSFFDSAESIVAGKRNADLSPAMSAIVNGCKNISDVVEKKVKFYEKLKSDYGIVEDTKDSYYLSDEKKYNLEGTSLPDSITVDEKTLEALKYCSHINVLRKGMKTADYLKCGYLFVTDTQRAIEVSEALIQMEKNKIGNHDENENYCEYAKKMSFLTNFLWYKMNRGFGSKQFPSNLDVVIKAKTILSSYVSQRISSTYTDINERFKNGQLTKESAALGIIAMKEKKVLPEEINIDNIDENLDFSKEYIENFIETNANNKLLLDEKQRIIDDLSSKINENEQKIQMLSEQLKSLVEEREKEKEQSEKQKRHKTQTKIFYLLLIIITLIVIAVGFFVRYICQLLGLDLGTWLGIIVSIILGSDFITNRLKMLKNKIIKD